MVIDHGRLVVNQAQPSIGDRRRINDNHGDTDEIALQHRIDTLPDKIDQGTLMRRHKCEPPVSEPSPTDEKIEQDHQCQYGASDCRKSPSGEEHSGAALAHPLPQDGDDPAGQLIAGHGLPQKIDTAVTDQTRKDLNQNWFDVRNDMRSLLDEGRHCEILAQQA